MSKLRVMTVVGTRPEIIRLARVITKLEAHTAHTLVHTGQNYDFELNEVFFRDLALFKDVVHTNLAHGLPAACGAFFPRFTRLRPLS